MIYNINFEICSLIFLALIICHFFAKRNYINLQGKIYSFYVIFILFCIVINLTSVYFIEHANEYPIIINYIMNEIYSCLLFVMPLIFLYYILSFTPLLRKPVLVLLAIPAVFGILMIVFNPYTDFYFYFDEQMQYVRGVGNVFIYINYFIYSFIIFIIIICYRKKLGMTLFLTAIGILIIMSAVLVYQYFYPKILISGMGSVLALYMLYLAMENPDIYSDSLTGVLNEKALHEQGAKSYILIVSMRDFKLINEIFSRRFGDRLLKKFAEFLMNETAKQRVFRVYGDIFIITLDQESEAYELASKVKNRINEEWIDNNISVKLSVKLGLMQTKGYESYEKLYAMVEHVISEMKKSKSKNLYIVDEKEKENLARKATIQRGIVDIISKGHIEMAYQPLYDIDGKLFAIEALARMNLVKYGYVSPEEFIRMSEINGSIYRLGNVIINEVLSFVEDNKERFKQGISVAINLSVIQIMKPGFAKSLVSLLDERKISHDKIVLEITESEAIYSDPTVMDNLKALKEAGFSLAMDDYGTGYANLNNLIDIPFSTIKIDKQVVWNSMRNRKAKIILINTIRMLQQLDFEIVAEGIETEEHLEQMKRLSINLYQGYFYTKPLSRYELWEELDKI